MSIPLEHVSVDATIGDRVHQLMWRNRVTQVELARSLGIAQTTLSRKLRGERPWYSGEIVTVARTFGTTVGFLFGETQEPRPGELAGAPRAVRPEGFEPPTF